MALRAHAPYDSPSKEARDIGCVGWRWTSFTPTAGGNHSNQYSWEALLVNGRIVEGECTKMGGGIWHIEARCINDPAKPPKLQDDLEYRNGGIVGPQTRLLAQWAKMPAV
jgi:hypothetical protein